MRDTRPKKLAQTLHKVRSEERAKTKVAIFEIGQRWVALISELLDRLESGEETIEGAREGIAQLREALLNSIGEDGA